MKELPPAPAYEDIKRRALKGLYETLGNTSTLDASIQYLQALERLIEMKEDLQEKNGTLRPLNGDE